MIRNLLIQAGLGLLPVLLFLAALELIDTYKLLRFRRVLYTFAAGCGSALFCYALNSAAVSFGAAADPWARFGSPPLEEIAKALCVFWLIRAGRIGFMVDAAISGFAVGAGFAVVENLFYLLANPDLGIGTSAVRGFGTAIMHSGTTAIFAIAAISSVELRGSVRAAAWAPGLALAILVHTLYNQFLLPPTASAAVLLVVLPSLFALIFWRSERALENWIGTKLDKDMDLLTMIAAGHFTESHAGSYLRSLEKTFGAAILGDMVCYLQLSLELSAQAKGALMRREMGFPDAPDPELPGRLKELAYLDKQIGRAGKLALAPLLGSNHRQIWEIHQLT